MNEDTFLKENIVSPWVFNRQLISGSIYCFFVPLYDFLLRIVAVAFWPVTEIHVENLFTLSGGVPNGDCSVKSYESVIAVKLEQISMIVRNFRHKLEIRWDLVLWKTLISWCSVYSLPIFFLMKQSKTKPNQTGMKLYFTLSSNLSFGFSSRSLSMYATLDIAVVESAVCAGFPPFSPSFCLTESKSRGN